MDAKYDDQMSEKIYLNRLKSAHEYKFRFIALAYEIGKIILM